MSGADIAARFEAANEEAVDLVLGPAAQAWHVTTEAEGWPVGVVARHIALGHDLMAGWARAVKTREPVEVDDIHAVNAEVAARGVVADPAEVAELLRSRGEVVASALRALADDDLVGEVPFGGRQMPAEMLATASIRHVESHLASIRATVEAAAQRHQ